eukprot:4681422-Ditylum_brightwellii.AAC.1
MSFLTIKDGSDYRWYFSSKGIEEISSDCYDFFFTFPSCQGAGHPTNIHVDTDDSVFSTLPQALYCFL